MTNSEKLKIDNLYDELKDLSKRFTGWRYHQEYYKIAAKISRLRRKIYKGA